MNNSDQLRKLARQNVVLHRRRWVMGLEFGRAW